MPLVVATSFSRTYDFDIAKIRKSFNMLYQTAKNLRLFKKKQLQPNDHRRHHEELAVREAHP